MRIGSKYHVGVVQPGEGKQGRLMSSLRASGVAWTLTCLPHFCVVQAPKGWSLLTDENVKGEVSGFEGGRTSTTSG